MSGARVLVATLVIVLAALLVAYLVVVTRGVPAVGVGLVGALVVLGVALDRWVHR